MGGKTIGRVALVFKIFLTVLRSLMVPMASSYNNRQFFVLALQLLGNPITMVTILKLLHRYYGIKHFFFNLTCAAVFPFLTSFYSLVKSIACPHMAALISNLALIITLVLLVFLGVMTYAGKEESTMATALPVTMLFVMMIWPWIAMMSMISRLHIGGDKKQNQFSPLKHLPVLGLMGSASLILTMAAAKTLTITMFICITFLDPCLSVLPSMILGMSRLMLSLRFLKLYILLVVLFIIYYFGDISPWQEDMMLERFCECYVPKEAEFVDEYGPLLCPTTDVWTDESRPPPRDDVLSALIRSPVMMLILARFLTGLRSMYVKWSFATFNDAHVPIYPLATQQELFEPSGFPRKHRFRDFPGPTLDLLDAIWDSGLADMDLHGIGPLGTTDLYKLTDWIYLLPTAAIASWIWEQPCLEQHGIFGIMHPQNQEETEAPTMVPTILLIFFSFSYYLIPYVAARALFDRGSSAGEWKYRPFIILTPLLVMDVLYETYVTRFQIVIMLAMFIIAAYLRAGLWNRFKMKRLLITTQEMSYIQPSSLRTIQRRTLLEYIENTSVDDYQNMLMETAVHQGNNIRSVVRAVGLPVWDPRPCATAAWKLAASHVVKAMNQQKAITKSRTEKRLEIVNYIQGMIVGCGDRAIEICEGHGQRVALAAVWGQQVDKRRVLRRLFARVKFRKQLRELRAKGLSNVPLVQATSGGAMRDLSLVTPAVSAVPGKAMRSGKMSAASPRSRSGGRSRAASGGHTPSRSRGRSRQPSGHPSAPRSPHHGSQPRTPTRARSALRSPHGGSPQRSGRGSVVVTETVIDDIATLPGTLPDREDSVYDIEEEKGFRSYLHPSQMKLPHINTVAIAFGEGKQGQLGVPQEDRDVRGHVLVIDETRGRDMYGVAAGGSCTFGVSGAGKVWVTGTFFVFYFTF